MNIFSLLAIGGSLFLASKLLTAKKISNTNILLEGVRLVKLETGYAKIGAKFRIVNPTSEKIDFENYFVKIDYLQTTIATGSNTFSNVSIPPNSEGIIEIIVNTANYSVTLLNIIKDLFSGTGNKKQINVNYSIKVKGLPQYSDTILYNL